MPMVLTKGQMNDIICPSFSPESGMKENKSIFPGDIANFGSISRQKAHGTRPEILTQAPCKCFQQHPIFQFWILMSPFGWRWRIISKRCGNQKPRSELCSDTLHSHEQAATPQLPLPQNRLWQALQSSQSSFLSGSNSMAKQLWLCQGPFMCWGFFLALGQFSLKPLLCHRLPVWIQDHGALAFLWAGLPRSRWG